eukprot:5124511-Prymnesium_polylepis.1
MGLVSLAAGIIRPNQQPGASGHWRRRGARRHSRVSASSLLSRAEAAVNLHVSGDGGLNSPSGVDRLFALRIWLRRGQARHRERSDHLDGK